MVVIIDFSEEVKEDDIYLKCGHLTNSDKFFWTDMTDRQTDSDRQTDRHCGS